MNVHEFRRILLQTLLVPVLLLLVVAAALSWQIESMVKAQEWLDHTDQVTAQLQELERLIIDQAAGLRGYQLTMNRLMLAPYQSGSELIPGRFEALRQLIADNPSQSRNLAELSDRYQIWLAFSQSVLALPADSMRDLALNLRGKQLMDEVRARAATMREAENQLRQQRASKAHRQEKFLLTVLLGAALGSGLLIAFFVWNRLRRVSRAYRDLVGECEKHTHAAYESKQWLETTLQSIGDGVIACDGNGRIQFMNEVACELTGWNIDAARNLPLEDVFHVVNEKTGAAVENPVERVRRLKTVVGLSNHTILVRKDGAELVLDDSAAPIRSPGGEMTGIVLVFRDVTARRRSENALIASEKLAVAGRLAATIAHEIHNPLDSVANIHYLLWTEADPRKRDEYLKLAQQELGRALQISRAMLSLYREPEAPVEIELKELMESVLLLLSRKLEQQDVVIEKRLTVVRIEGFPAELRQVFTNLILNAVEAAGPAGNIRILVEKFDSNDHRGALVEIADSGPGIDPDVQKKIFEPFFTTKGEQGTGLGLWVSQGIVQKHGGTLLLLNSPDQRYPGAVVRVFLPAETHATAVHRATAYTA